MVTHNVTKALQESSMIPHRFVMHRPFNLHLFTPEVQESFAEHSKRGNILLV
jgi:hypothetical protein